MILKPKNKEKIKGKTEAFLSSKGWKNAPVFLGFIVLASGFWMLQYFQEKFEFEIPMKVNYMHIPAGIALSDKLPQIITLHVQDKGSAFLNYKYKSRKQPLSITINMGTISLNRTSYLIDPSTLYALITDQLFATTQLKTYSPDRIEINYSPLAQKELPIGIHGTISPAFGYLFLDSIRIEPSQVIAFGAKNALDTLQIIRTKALNYNNINNHWTVSAELQAPEGIHLSIDHVMLSAETEEYTEKTFELPVLCNNIPSNRKIHFFPSTIELSVKVGLSKYSQLSKTDFEIAVNYNDLKEKSSTNCSLTLTQKPRWVDNYRIIPEVIEFLIEQKSD